MRKARLYNSYDIPYAWSNICDNTTDMHDAIEDATNSKELVNNVNAVCRRLRFNIDRETDCYVRLIATDTLGNITYIKAYK